MLRNLPRKKRISLKVKVTLPSEIPCTLCIKRQVAALARERAWGGMVRAPWHVEGVREWGALTTRMAVTSRDILTCAFDRTIFLFFLILELLI